MSQNYPVLQKNMAKSFIGFEKPIELIIMNVKNQKGEPLCVYINNTLNKNSIIQLADSYLLCVIGEIVDTHNKPIAYYCEATNSANKYENVQWIRKDTAIRTLIDNKYMYVDGSINKN